MKSARLTSLPEDLRRSLIEARRKRGWSQAELGKRVGLPQMHISQIERGKVVPRYSTVLDLVRVLDYDLLLVPRPLVPVVQSLIRESRRPAGAEDEDERPLYLFEDDPPGKAS